MERQPSSSEPDRRTEIIYVRATEEEKERIYALAAAANLSASRFLIRLATDGRPPPTEEERERLERLLFLLRRASLSLHRLTGNLRTLRLAGATEGMREEFLEAAHLLTQLMLLIRSRL